MTQHALLTLRAARRDIDAAIAMLERAEANGDDTSQCENAVLSIAISFNTLLAMVARNIRRRLPLIRFQQDNDND